MRNRWSIAIYKGPTPFTLQPAGKDVPAISPETVTGMKCRAVADPFLICGDGQWYMFFEALDDVTNRGEIAYATSGDLVHWAYGGVVLREDFHLSYPLVVEHSGTYYMIPETRQAGQIRLYAAADFPHDWRLVSILARGDYADSTMFFHNGKWRMFAQRGLDETRLFHSEKLEDGWKQHPGNPFWEANRTYCRPGGRPLYYEGKWHRFVQDGLQRYGSHVRALRIARLTDEEFEETEIGGSPILGPSMRGWNAMGMHHLDAIETAEGQWLGAVDGVTNIF